MTRLLMDNACCGARTQMGIGLTPRSKLTTNVWQLKSNDREDVWCSVMHSSWLIRVNTV